MKALLNTIKETMTEIELDMDKAMDVQAAAKRIRKNSLDLEKQLKEFRKVSIDHHKK